MISSDDILGEMTSAYVYLNKAEFAFVWKVFLLWNVALDAMRLLSVIEFIKTWREFVINSGNKMGEKGKTHENACANDVKNARGV